MPPPPAGVVRVAVLAAWVTRVVRLRSAGQVAAGSGLVVAGLVLRDVARRLTFFFADLAALALADGVRAAIVLGRTIAGKGSSGAGASTCTGAGAGSKVSPWSGPRDRSLKPTKMKSKDFFARLAAIRREVNSPSAISFHLFEHPRNVSDVAQVILGSVYPVHRWRHADTRLADLCREDFFPGA